MHSAQRSETRLGQGWANNNQAEPVVEGKTGLCPSGLLFVGSSQELPRLLPRRLRVLWTHPLPWAKFPQIFCQVALKSNELTWLWTLLKIIIIVGQGVAQTKKRADFRALVHHTCTSLRAAHCYSSKTEDQATLKICSGTTECFPFRILLQ